MRSLTRATIEQSGIRQHLSGAEKIFRGRGDRVNLANTLAVKALYLAALGALATAESGAVSGVNLGTHQPP